MLVLRIYAPEATLPAALKVLNGRAGINHVIQAGYSPRRDVTLVTADVDPNVVDRVLPDLAACGIAGDELELIHRESNRPLGSSRVADAAWSGGGLAWTELAMTSRQYARAVPRYLLLMACAGIIAVFGVLDRNLILVVGAMAISPDLLPLCATCVGLVSRRPRLAMRALAVLLAGLAVAGLAAFVVATLLRVGKYPPTAIPLGDGGLGVLPSVNVATVTVAFVAGIVGILAFETRSSAAVGVAISVTTIPAAAFIGAAAAMHDGHGTRAALAVLAANVVVIVLAGTMTLIAQRLVRRTRS